MTDGWPSMSSLLPGSQSISAPPAKAKNDKKKEVAAKAMERPNTTWISRRSPPPMSPNARLKPVTMMMTTATTLATGPSMDSRMRCSGASHGMPEPAAMAASLAITQARATSDPTPAARSEISNIGVGFTGVSPSHRVQGRPSERLEDVVAIGIEADDLEQCLDPAVDAATFEKHHDVDRLHDQVARYRDDGLLDELLQTQEPGRRRIGMHGGDAAGVAGVPGLEHVEGFGPPHLTDDNAVGAQPERRAHQVAQAGDAGFGAQRHA